MTRLHLKWWFLISALLSSAYFAYPNVLTKILPILALSVFAYYEGSKYAYLIAAGLIFSLIGDVCLSLDGDVFLLFMSGVLNFFIAHSFYITAFRSTVIDFRYGLHLGAVYLVYYACLMGFIVPALDALLIPAILLYGAVLLTMSFLASNRYFNPQSSRALAAIGSLFFLASDSTLCVTRFRSNFQGGDAVVMATYYVGQTLIAMSSRDPNPSVTHNVIEKNDDVASPLMGPP
jgi:uncharacterized membrane protein YhhN